MAMSRTTLGAMVAAGALWVGVVAIGRRQYWIGVLALAIAVLRGITVFYALRGGAAKKHSDGVRLNLEPPKNQPGADGNVSHRPQSGA